MHSITLQKKTKHELYLGKNMPLKRPFHPSVIDLSKVLPVKFIPHLRLMKIWLFKHKRRPFFAGICLYFPMKTGDEQAETQQP